MVKFLKIIFCAFLLLAAFFAGVRYSDPVKEIGNWLFESKSEEIDFENLEQPNEPYPYDGQQNLNNSAPMEDNPAGTIEENIEPTIIIENDDSEVEGTVNPPAPTQPQNIVPAVNPDPANNNIAPAPNNAPKKK